MRALDDQRPVSTQQRRSSRSRGRESSYAHRVFDRFGVDFEQLHQLLAFVA
jgi:hypothetical protein